MSSKAAGNDLPFSTDRPGSQQEAEQFCQALTTTMGALLAIIKQETELVRAGNLIAAGSLQPDKARLIHEYTRGMLCARNHAVVLGNLAPVRVQALRRQHNDFQPILRLNLAVLSTAREVSSSVMEAASRASEQVR
ncbi:hypothetical protein [Roseibium sp. RKSG952]|uniref:hypothetical protein n=1 Tax=Roseibium sp. RKSG952 TaxID=2529384 RepID=UPI001AD8E797|nr:hypothetical protein [Roseibium sp. RKSG952]